MRRLVVWWNVFLDILNPSRMTIRHIKERGHFATYDPVTGVMTLADNWREVLARTRNDALTMDDIERHGKQ